MFWCSGPVSGDPSAAKTSTFFLKMKRMWATLGSLRCWRTERSEEDHDDEAEVAQENNVSVSISSGETERPKKHMRKRSI